MTCLLGKYNLEAEGTAGHSYCTVHYGLGWLGRLGLAVLYNVTYEYMQWRGSIYFRL